MMVQNVKSFAGEQLSDALAVTNVDLYKPRLWVQVLTAARNQAVQHPDLMSIFQKAIHYVRPDKTSASCDENFHNGCCYTNRAPD